MTPDETFERMMSQIEDAGPEKLVVMLAGVVGMKEKLDPALYVAVMKALAVRLAIKFLKGEKGGN